MLAESKVAMSVEMMVSLAVVGKADVMAASWAAPWESSLAESMVGMSVEWMVSTKAVLMAAGLVYWRVAMSVEQRVLTKAA